MRKLPGPLHDHQLSTPPACTQGRFILATFRVLDNAYIFMQYVKTSSSIKAYIESKRVERGFFKQMMRRTTTLFARNSDYKKDLK
jgi:hypothetical protein